jgi:hypothetical protein
MRLSRSMVHETAAEHAVAAIHALAACVAPLLANSCLVPRMLYPLHVIELQLGHHPLEVQKADEAADQVQQPHEYHSVAVQQMHNSIIQAITMVRLMVVTLASWAGCYFGAARRLQ